MIVSLTQKEKDYLCIEITKESLSIAGTFFIDWMGSCNRSGNWFPPDVHGVELDREKIPEEERQIVEMPNFGETY